jgi:hypothetical protein
MAKVSGDVVAFVTSKVFKGRTYWSFKLNNGEDWYRTGLIEPPFGKGQKVSFEFTTDTYGNQVDVNTISVDADTPVVEAAPKTAYSGKGYVKGAAKPGNDSKEAYFEKKAKDDVDRQKIISYQAAMNTAVAIANLAVANDALPIAGKNKAEKWESLNSLVTKLAEDLVISYMNAPERVDALVQDASEAGELIGSNEDGEDVWND